jgi:hypothetical protein
MMCFLAYNAGMPGSRAHSTLLLVEDGCGQSSGKWLKRAISSAWSTMLTRTFVGMAVLDDILLFRSIIVGPSIPPILHVRHSTPVHPRGSVVVVSKVQLIARMRYSRLLEESSFSNRRADYVWLLTLCATFLLVSRDSCRPTSC